MKKCDIIIPIYNAYDYVESCIDSVIKNTNLEENRIILIDDKSPDERIIPLLKKYKDKYPLIELIFNKENRGFVGTVNTGMKLSKNDVILLNSDTEVTPNWLDKIKKCAYSQKKVATVTPLSNNATMASVPKSFVPNELPNGYSLEEMARLVEECSLRDYPEVPTGHGFCIYIKREALDDIGFFDEESFGKGYGEENDFCFRALNKGYRHLICDDTYIYHKESQSFAEDKKELIENGLKVLEERYTKYKDRLDLWCNMNAIKYIGDNITISIEGKKERANILYLIHDYKDIENNLGGTSLHVYDLIQSMRDKYNFHILAPEDGIYKLYTYWENSESVISFPGNLEFHELRYYNSKYKKMVEEIIDIYNISIIHIHHLIGHYFDIVDILKERKIYSIITLHDYYSACPLINKIYKNKEYCNKPSQKTCKECLNHCLGIDFDISAWRAEWNELFKTVDRIITPSESANKEILKTFPNTKISAIEHGIDIKKSNAVYLEDKKNYNVAFIGAIGIHKGSRILENLMNYKKLRNIRIHLFGKVNSPNQKNTKYFKNHGKYSRDELKTILHENEIDLICLFSTWPETYSYTLTEAIACGIPVLAYDLGAIAERIKKYNLGWVIDSKSNYEEVCENLHSILNDKKAYGKVVDSINKYKIKSVKEMGRDYIKIYQKEVSVNLVNIEKMRQHLTKDAVCNPTNISYNNYAWVFDTLKWKIISKVKLPKFVKKIVKR